MPGIVCAIRGGPASQPTIRKAIELSLETGLTVHFLYIVNLDFVARTATSRTHLISQEMEQMGEFILLTAQSKADLKGVRSESVIRHGGVSEEITKLCQDLAADYAVLGRPKVQDGEDVFTHERLDAFAQRIEAESGAGVVFAE